MTQGMVKSTKEESLLLGNKMLIIFILSFFVISCFSESQAVPNTKIMDVKQELKQEVYGSGSINNFLLKLEKSAEGKCVLFYKNELIENSQEEKIVLDMDAPCEFVRLGKTDKILYYSYKNKKNEKYDAVIIVGGKPDLDKTDSLMPGGCGTEFVAVSIFADKIKTTDNIDAEGPICPAKGLDEIYFGMYAKS
jgi:hypothetical protein